MHRTKDLVCLGTVLCDGIQPEDGVFVNSHNGLPETTYKNTNSVKTIQINEIILSIMPFIRYNNVQENKSNTQFRVNGLFLIYRNSLQVQIVTVFWLPETVGMPMLTTIEEAEDFYSKSKRKQSLLLDHK